MRHFKFNAVANSVVTATAPELVVDLKPFSTNKPAPACPTDDNAIFLKMMAEGKLPLPTPFQRLSTDRLMELGYPKVLWSKKYGVKYVMHRMYSRGGDVS
jgi:hypothetical protein